MSVTYPELESGYREQVEIYTLGRFLIKRGETVLSDDLSRSKKVWELFKYLLTHRDRATLPEVLLETLWIEQDYANPGLAMRSLVFRLRRLLEKLTVPELASAIVFSQGGYKWSAGTGCRLDADEFESLYRRAGGLVEAAPAEAIDTYQQAIALYKGEFLPECAYCDWAVPARSYYRRIYLQSLTNLLGLLKSARRFTEIIELCEDALLLEYFEEEIHIRYLEALLKEGRTRQARTHYDEVTATFYREMGAKPSAELSSLCRLFNRDNEVDLDLDSIQDGLQNRQRAGGPFFCDRALFNFFYRHESVRRDRVERPVYLGTLALACAGGPAMPPGSLNQGMEVLQEALSLNLRKGDVVARWNDSQFLLLLTSADLEQAGKVLERLERKFREKFGNPDLILHRGCQDIPQP